MQPVPGDPHAPRRRTLRHGRPLRRPVAAFVAVFAVAVAACGGGRSDESTSTASAARTTQTASSALEAQYERVVNKVSPQVVQIETDSGLGSGVVFDDRGDIVTNAHVVAGANRFRVTAADGKRFTASLVGSFAPGDLAVVRAHDAGLHAATFGRSSELRVGDIVLAIGNPLGLQSSVTDGIVSALGRTVSEPGGNTLPNVIQTSAPINPGNSGGALVGLDGRVVGIPTLAATDPELGGSAAPGIGFAIPSDVVRDLAGQIIDHGRVVNSHRAYLGVRLATTTGARGAVVAGIDRAGPADKAGIGPGDLILAIDGKRVAGPEDVAAVLATLKPGEMVDVEVALSGGGRKKMQVRLGSYPSGG